jgi:hypothetical protein
MTDLLFLIPGLALLALVLWDVFETIVVPRPTPGWFRIGRYVIRFTWRGLRRAADWRGGSARDRWLGLFAPAATIMLLFAWLLSLIIAFGLILYALRGDLSPPPPDLGTALYFAASSILTIGYGDIVATDGLARIVVVAGAAVGLGLVALVVTFLFSLFGSYQRREAPVVLLQAKAGAPPSAVVLLENLARMDLSHRLPDFFNGWESWEVEVLDSHVAYPLLGYFRSSHDNLSWISALGAVLDTATLVSTTILDVPRGQAELVIALGNHLVEDISNLGFRRGTASGIQREDYDAVHSRLEIAGYRLVPADEAWPRFRAVRAGYETRLEQMANYWAVSNVSWLGSADALRSPAHLAPRTGAEQPSAGVLSAVPQSAAPVEEARASGK